MKKFKIQKNDYDRSLITETIPYETPIIFSNSGFYNLLSSKDLKNIIQSKIIDKIISDKDIKSTPYHYKIKKDVKTSFYYVNNWQLKELTLQFRQRRHIVSLFNDLIWYNKSQLRKRKE